MLHSSDVEDWLKRGLCEAILVLCKSGLKFQSQFSINGLLAITVDQREVFLINIKETVGHSSEPLLMKEDSMEDGNDLSFINQSRYANGSRKVQFKRKSSDKNLRKNSSLPEVNIEKQDASIKDVKKSEGFETSKIHDHLDNMVCFNNEDISNVNLNRSEMNEDDDDDDDDDDLNNLKTQRDTNNDLMANHNATDNNSSKEIFRNDLPGFDLSLVKVEKDDDTYIPCDGHLQQSFHPQDNTWQSKQEFNISRTKGRRLLNHELSNDMILDQYRHHMLNTTHQQHSNQRRVAREGRCENCGTRKTTAWRRSDLKELLCNACGCYYKLHKYHRPLHMAQNEIKTRCRRSKHSDHPLVLKPPLIDQSYHIIRGMEASEINQSYFPGPVPS